MGKSGAATFPRLVWDETSIVDRHPELHHYTTLEGLKGIVGSQSIRATRFDDLNDATELNFLKQPLMRELTPVFEALLRTRAATSPRLSREISEAGGLEAAAEQNATIMTSLLYASSFTPQDGVTGIPELQSPPFLASFCIHTDESYEQRNGLLSQWRGYSSGGGFCIVFDTAGILSLLQDEYAARLYITVALNEVQYLYNDSSISDLFPGLIDTCSSILQFLLNNSCDEPEANTIFGNFLAAAPFCKHPAFHEEREVRIAVRLATQGWRAAVVDGQSWTLPPEKEVCSSEGARRYVTLFEDLNRALPIKRVIVGPSVHQAENAEIATGLVGDGILVELSETPFVERR